MLFMLYLIIKQYQLCSLYNNYMSQRQFHIRRSNERQRQQPHSQKSAVSAKESLARKKEAEWFENRLKDLRRRKKQVKQEADNYWKQAKEFEAQGRINQALQAKTMCEKEAEEYTFYNKQIVKVEKKLRQLYEVPTGLQMGKTIYNQSKNYISEISMI